MSSFSKIVCCAALVAAGLLACGREPAEKQLRLTRVYPACGPQGTATHLTLTGLGFAAGDTVLVGKTAATQVQVVSPKEIHATTPSLPAGALAVTVIDPAGARRTLVNAFRACDPRTFDPNGDCRIDSVDVIYLNNFVAGRGPAPVLSGDANGDGTVDRKDVDWLVAYLMANGPAPRAPLPPGR